MSHDYVPTNNRALLTWAKNLLAYTTPRFGIWGIADPVPMLHKPIADFEAALEKAEDPNHGKVDTILKEDTRKALSKLMRMYIQGFLAKNPNVTDEDRKALGITVYDKTMSPVKAPDRQVEGDIHFPGVGLIEVRNIHYVGDMKSKKPDYGVRIYYGVIGIANEADTLRIVAVPKSGEDLPRSIFTRTRKHLFEFPGNSGMKVFFCMRCENAKGEAGPWGPIMEAYVP